MKLQPNHIYRYSDNESTPLCVCICNAQTSDHALIVPLVSDAADGRYKLSITEQYADLGQYREIHTSCIVGALYLKSKHATIPAKDAIYIQNYIISDMMQQINNDAHKNNTSFPLFEAIYYFLKWKHQKLLLNTNPFQKKTDVYENGLYWASLGVNVGSELNKNRPVLIWKKRCSGEDESKFSYIVIPITSKEKNAKYYMNVPIDINGRKCYLRIEDMHRISIKRISRPIIDDSKKLIFIDSSKRKEINTAIQRFYVFESTHANA